MSISAVEIELPKAEDVRVTEDTLIVDLSDGRTISVPLVWFPRLLHPKPKERKNWRLIGSTLQTCSRDGATDLQYSKQN
jgi:hypothetical protein